MVAKRIDKDEQRRNELYDSFRKDTCAHIASSSDDFDKSILTYSSAGLGLSIAFAKDIVDLKEATITWLLYCSWGAFCLAIVLTTLSFLLSMKAHMRTLADAEKYYLQNLPSYQNRFNPYDLANTVLVRTAGAAFITAVIFTVIFASLNLHKENTMSKTNHYGRPVAGMPSADRGRPVTAMTPAPSPATSSLPTPTPTQQAPSTQTTRPVSK